MSDWTDEEKAEVIEKYKAANPTPENTMDIVEQLAEEFDKTPNRVRVLLSKNGAYVAKGKAKAKTSEKKSGDGAKRVSKQDSIDALVAKIEELGGEVDSDILDKLTGKAAIYFLNVLNTVSE